VPTVIATTTPLARGAGASVVAALYAGLLDGACVGEALTAARRDDPEDIGAVPWLLLGDPSAILGRPRPPAPQDGAAWVGVWVDAKVSDPDKAASIRGPIQELVRAEGQRLGLEPQVSAAGQAVLFGLPPSRFGDRTGEAGLGLAERLRDTLSEDRVAGLGGRFGATLGVGLAVGPGAPSRAVELARRAAPDVLIVDGDGKESSRRERRVFIELRRPASDGTLAWEARPGSVAPPRPLLGRRDELHALQRGFDEVKRRHETRLVLITGSAGSGKSALVQGFGRRLADRGVEVQTLELTELGGPTERYPSESATAAVLVYEDAHRLGDRQFGELLHRLARPRPPALVIVTLRADSPPRRLRLAQLQDAATDSIPLPALSAADASALARQLLGRANLSRDEERLLGLADGNPLLIRLLAGRLRGAGVQGDEPPALVRGMITDRLAGAGAEVARVLEGVAVLGQPCTTDALEALPGVTPSAVAQAAAEGWLTLRSEMLGGRRVARCRLRDRMMARYLDALVDTDRGPELHQAAFQWHSKVGSGASKRARHALRSAAPLQAVAPLWEAILAGGGEERYTEHIDALERLLATTPETEMPVDAPTSAQVRAVRHGLPGLSVGGYRVRGLIAVDRLATRFLVDRPEGELELRLVHPELVPNPPSRRRFEEHLQRLRALNLPSLVPVGDSLEIDGQLVLPARWFAGESTRTHLARHGALAPAQAAAVAGEVLGLLAALAQRSPETASALDLRPEGIWLGDDGRVRVEHLTALQGGRCGR